MTSIDKRVIKTKREIKLAFIELLSDVPFEQITIKDIANKAQISRKTFYSHYNGIYELVEEMKETIAQSTKKVFLTIDFNNDINKPLLLLNKIIDGLTEDLRIYARLLGNKKNIEFNYQLIEIVGEMIIDMYSTKLRIRDVEENKQLIKRYVIYGSLHAYSEYYPTANLVNINNFIKTLAAVMFEGLNGFIKFDKIF